METKEEHEYMGGYTVWSCAECFRDCAVVSRYTSGPPECPYGNPDSAFEEEGE